MISDETKHQALFWNSALKRIPPRPNSDISYLKTDRNFWYDQEYAGWNVNKAVQPRVISDGVRGKRIAAFLADNHPYLSAYQSGLKRASDQFGINLEIYNSQWDPNLQEEQIEAILKNPPDLIFLIPESNQESSYLYKRIYEAGIPVIASNLLPDAEGFKYILSWTGPDDWAQSRALAESFAQLMKGQGGYAVITHIDETSAYYARKWGVITQITENYKDMTCLCSESGNLNREHTRQIVLGWLKKYGSELKGIISADDNVCQLGINDALKEMGRTDIIRAANGSTTVGINMVLKGELDIITWQNPEMDGELPIQVAVDWFNGLQISPLRYLPVMILDRDNISSINSKEIPFSKCDPDILYKCILEIDEEGVHRYFELILDEVNDHPTISTEYIQGFSFEILSNLLNLIKTESLDGTSIMGSYEDLFKNLIRQKTAEAAIQWLRSISIKLCLNISDKRSTPKSVGKLIVEYVNSNFTIPMSLKTLSVQFNLSAAYLGQLFREETDEVFSTYLNRIRIERACTLLDQNMISASQVGIDVGFSSPNYFFRTFHKNLGCSPAEYKNRNQSLELSPEK